MLEPRHKGIPRTRTCDTVTGANKTLCQRASSGVVPYASQMLTNATPETLPSFADVKMGASAAGDTVHKIFRSAGRMIADFCRWKSLGLIFFETSSQKEMFWQNKKKIDFSLLIFDCRKIL